MKLTTFKSWLLVGTFAFASGSGALLADEEIAVKDLPTAVINAIEAKFPGAELTSAELETEDGKTYYEVEIRYDDEEWEVEVAADGQIIEIEKD